MAPRSSPSISATTEAMSQRTVLRYSLSWRSSTRRAGRGRRAAAGRRRLTRPSRTPSERPRPGRLEAPEPQEGEREPEEDGDGRDQPLPVAVGHRPGLRGRGRGIHPSGLGARQDCPLRAIATRWGVRPGGRDGAPRRRAPGRRGMTVVAGHDRPRPVVCHGSFRAPRVSRSTGERRPSARGVPRGPWPRGRLPCSGPRSAGRRRTAHAAAPRRGRCSRGPGRRHPGAGAECHRPAAAPRWHSDGCRTSRRTCSTR